MPRDYFADRSTKRVSDATRYVEQQQRSPAGTRRGALPVPFLFRRFELKDELTIGGTADA